MAEEPLTVAPPVALIAAGGLCALLLRAAAGPGTTAAVVLGTVGPLLGGVATWLAVRRTHARAPAEVPGLMIKLFGAKLVGFAAYVAFVLLVVLQETTVFVVSFTCQYILLHLVQAVYLRRLFARI